MKRLMMLIALVGMMSAPTMATAQSIPEAAMSVSVPAESIGDGWAITYQEKSSGYPSPWDQQIIYGGPEGARVTVWVVGLGYGINWVSGSWVRLTEFWIDEAVKFTNIDDPEKASYLDDEDWTIESDLVTDRKAVESNGPIVVGVAQYGAYDLQIGLLVVAEGTVNGLTGVAATDYVAGLYFAALSGQ